MLRAVVPPAEVARRLGHSVEMLLRVYAGVFEDDTNLANTRLDELFDGLAVAEGPAGSRSDLPSV
jgi:hypothetical protein